jgi:hypothetical protein
MMRSERLGHVVGISHGGRRSPRSDLQAVGVSEMPGRQSRCLRHLQSGHIVGAVEALIAAGPADSSNRVSLLDITIQYWEVASNKGQDTTPKQG